MDLIIYFHLLFVAIGLGLAVRLDFLFFQRRLSTVGKTMLADTLHSHYMISSAMLGLWVTGLSLIYLRTGFDISELSPKVTMKLIIVALLSFNAITIAWYVLPVMRRFTDRPLLAVPVRYKLPMAISAATSVFCWLSALALGSMSFLKTQTWDNLTTTFGTVYCVGLAVAILIALFVKVPEFEGQVEHAKEA